MDWKHVMEEVLFLMPVWDIVAIAGQGARQHVVLL
jgi:hypothetical protein